MSRKGSLTEFVFLFSRNSGGRAWGRDGGALGAEKGQGGWLQIERKGGRSGKALGGTPLYTLYRYVPPSRVGFLRCSVLKKGILFGIFWLFVGYFLVFFNKTLLQN